MLSKKAVLASLFLAPCVTCVAGGADKPAEAAAETKAITLPRANPPLFIEFSDSCPISKEGGRESPLLLMLLGTLLKPVVETAVPAAVGWVYDRGVHVLEARNAKLQASSTAITTTVMYDTEAKNYRFGCLILARAARGPKMEVGAAYLRQEHGGSAVLPAGSPWLESIAPKVANSLRISRVPEFYLELAFTSVMSNPEKDINVLNALPALLPKGKAALTEADRKKYAEREPRSMYRQISPTHLDYFASGAERVNNGSKNVSIEIHMDAMDTKGEWQPFYVKTYDLGRLKVSSSDINLDSYGKDVFVPPPLRRTADGFIDPVPVRVSATLTETDDNIDLSRALETAFKEAQARKSTVDAVAKALVDKLQEKIDEKTGTAPAKK